MNLEIIISKGERLCGVTKIETHPLIKDINIFYMGDRKVLSVGGYTICKK